MSAIIQMSIDVTKIDKSKLKDGKYLNVSISVNNETKFDNNVSMCYNQSKEERESGAKKTYFANGKVIWTDGVIKVAEKSIQNDLPSGNAVAETDLPF
jgi:hypothetical protein|tara:strand:- start:1679 stop:1972 length:294 start_codon:yes stop_codon:yes gene_type:complete